MSLLTRITDPNNRPGYQQEPAAVPIRMSVRGMFNVESTDGTSIHNSRMGKLQAENNDFAETTRIFQCLDA